MRRSTVLIGLAILATTSAATAAYLVKDNADRHKLHQRVEVHNLALCEKTLEIAASLYSYAGHGKEAEADALWQWNASYYSRLENEERANAYKLGFSKAEYDAMLRNARFEAEKSVIPQLTGADDPIVKVTEMIPACVNWPPRY